MIDHNFFAVVIVRLCEISLLLPVSPLLPYLSKGVKFDLLLVEIFGRNISTNGPSISITSNSKLNLVEVFALS